MSAGRLLACSSERPGYLLRAFLLVNGYIPLVTSQTLYRQLVQYVDNKGSIFYELTVSRHPLDALPLAEITRQYLAYLKDAKEADVEVGADFFETASWLVLLKSRSLLPQAPEEEPPARELERALLDHEMLRATAGLLRSRIDAAGIGPGSGPADSASLPGTDEIAAQPTVQDALLAARRALATARAHAQGSRVLESEGYPVAEILARLEQRLAMLEPGCGVSTEEWFAELPEREAQVTLLLALLELARLQRVLLAQQGPCRPILLKRLA